MLAPRVNVYRLILGYPESVDLLSCCSTARAVLRVNRIRI